MQFRRRIQPSVRTILTLGPLALLLMALTIGGPVYLGALSVAAGTPVHATVGSLPSAQNSSTGNDPTGSSSSITCPSSGPMILGVQWNCVAILNLTELAVILASIGIVAYVFKDSDQAELPGESAEVPVTAEEWEAYRSARRQGLPYVPAESQSVEEER